MNDQLENINKSMTYSLGDNVNLGDNVIKHAKLVRVCNTRGCYEKVYVSQINPKTGRVRYSCSKHGRRNYDQMEWFDITGSTMLEFRKVGWNESSTLKKS